MSNRIPDRSHYDPDHACWMHTGENARAAVDKMPSGHVAIDIETPGLDDAFSINCVTLAWDDHGETHTVLLDAVRNPLDGARVKEAVKRASMLILHNACFDVPALKHHGLIGYSDINRIVDTLVLARFCTPDPITPKTLSALVLRHLGWVDNADGMKSAFKAAGFKTIAAGWKGMDIDSPIYRQGAMLDTVGTLRLQPLLRQRCWDWSTDHPFEVYGATTHGAAEALLEIQEVDNRVMLRRTARGLDVDLDYLDAYSERVQVQAANAERVLAEHDLLGGKGKAPALIRYLDELGDLPHPWPRTPKGALRATKDDLAMLDHPLVLAQRTLSDVEQVMGFITKVSQQAAVTGRCHPQCGILGASATGRMSYTSPPMQQFNADARPVIISDGGLTSIDWSQIEPITMGIMAKDEKFLAPYEAGDDLYEPLMRAAGIDRPMAKIGLLADMYGQGPEGMARRLGLSIEQAQQIRRQMRAAMPKCTRWMSQVQGIAEQHGKIITAAGRILPVNEGGVFKSVNYIVQGSAYDVLAHTILEMERQGMGDEIHLAMHDEVVVSTAVAEEVQHIMATPPPFLERWLGRTPIIRTDRADMGRTWQKV